jgi:hypothetical protein
MSTVTKIEWTDHTPLRTRATAAARLGISLDEYDERRAAGEKWCGGCRAWQRRDEFGVDNSRGDGLAKWCKSYTSTKTRSTYQPRPRPQAGRRYAAARDGDQKQARGRVNHLVNVGILPDPNNVPCTDCGHVWMDGERRHEYDHHLGYAAERHEDVQSVCTTCHHARENARRAN